MFVSVSVRVFAFLAAGGCLLGPRSPFLPPAFPLTALVISIVARFVRSRIAWLTTVGVVLVFN